MKGLLSVIVLTHNEEQNLGDCLASMGALCDAKFVVDSYSSDKTLEVARSNGAQVVQHQFENYSKQYNWALENLPIRTKWVMRMDADERLTPELLAELSSVLPSLPDNVTGLYVKRRVHFMGRWIRHGGYYPVWLLRIWRTGQGCIEERWMDEHVRITGGENLFLKNDIYEENVKNLHWWIGKHNGYATREAIDLLGLQSGVPECNKVKPKLLGTQEQRKRWLKENAYKKIPLFARPFFYFIYRYFFKFGFMDGKEGLIWHFLQGFWYRFLVDAKIYEIKKNARDGNMDIQTVIKKHYGLDV
ncbi:MAG: glycosyltransferase family 2 protein [Nitrospiraceae bacterium]|nr:glycosyltransferase family 2 protein [Nitrospiraceae bacterium]